MNHIKPSGAPGCWGKKFQDGAEECMQCYYQSDCKNEMLYNLTRTPPPARSYAPPTTSQLAISSSSTIPMQPRPAPTTWTTPPIPQFPSAIQTTKPPSVPVAPIVPTPTTQPQPVTYFQQSTGYSLPNPAATPNPLAHWQRPGVPAQPYYFLQHPEESVTVRLAKNVILRALEAIFHELMQFFKHWTWPAGKK